MQFKQGMLGVAVVAVALAAAILGSWVMSLDVEEQEAIRYDQLTDITGLFSGSAAPEYTDYSPSSNYTGYYTDASTVGSERYFDGVTYTEAQRANNYRLNLAPIQSTSGTVTLPTSGSFSHNQVWLHYWNGSNTYAMSDDTTASYLRDVIAAVTGETSGTFTISSRQGADITTEFSNLSLDWVVLTNESSWKNGRIDLMTAENKEHIVGPLPDRYVLLALSAVADLDRGIVTLYYDNNFTNRLADIALDSCVAVYGGSLTPVLSHEVEFGDVATYSFELFPAAQYLDPSMGVGLT